MVPHKKGKSNCVYYLNNVQVLFVFLTTITLIFMITVHYRMSKLLQNFKWVFSTLLFFSKHKKSSFQNIFNKICFFKVWCPIFPLTHKKLLTYISTKPYNQIIWNCSSSCQYLAHYRLKDNTFQQYYSLSFITITFK